MKRGFTIWELIACVLILGILAAILYPVFTRVPHNAPRSACQSNMKNVGLGFQQYVQDYDNMLPRSREAGANRGWVDAMEPYVKSRMIYACPGNRGSQLASSGPYQTDYFFNQRLSGFDITRMPATRATVLNGEGDVHMDALAPHYAIASYAAIGSEAAEAIRKRHLEGSNFGFADGHIKWLRATETVGTASPRNVKYTFAPR